MDFTQMIDLAAERLGGYALAASDDFFAPKENLLRAAAPVWDPHRYTDRGKWMDGWESRRRRSAGHDWCVVRLGLPGVIRGVVVDTAHFKGNFPEACSVEACSLPDYPSLEEVLDEAVEWVEILPRKTLEGDQKNLFPIESPYRFTHLRLSIDPDGGVARLRVHGEPIPHRPPAGGLLDLAAAQHGGRALAASDLFFSAPGNLLLPDPATHMGDGWETRRRRGPGHDWVLIQLAAAGTVEKVEVDTRHFKGNAPGSCTLEGYHAPEATAEEILAAEEGWAELLPETRLQPHTLHHLEEAVFEGPPVTHVRFSIFPDGGVARLRLWGHPSRGGQLAIGLRWLNALPPAEARRELGACCGSRRWVEAMLEARPFADPEALRLAAAERWRGLAAADWLEAFAAHPKIGDRKAVVPTGARSARWSGEEQAGVSAAGGDVLRRLAEANSAYQETFGFIFIVCASGKSAEEMLALLEERRANPPDEELRIAADEQLEITQLRLEKLLAP